MGWCRFLRIRLLSFLRLHSQMRSLPNTTGMPLYSQMLRRCPRFFPPTFQESCAAPASLSPYSYKLKYKIHSNQNMKHNQNINRPFTALKRVQFSIVVGSLPCNTSFRNSTSLISSKPHEQPTIFLVKAQDGFVPKEQACACVMCV